MSAIERKAKQVEEWLSGSADLLERAMQLSNYVCPAGSVHFIRTSSWHDAVAAWLNEHRPDWRDRLPRVGPAGYTNCDGRDCDG